MAKLKIITTIKLLILLVTLISIIFANPSMHALGVDRNIASNENVIEFTIFADAVSGTISWSNRIFSGDPVLIGILLDLEFEAFRTASIRDELLISKNSPLIELLIKNRPGLDHNSLPMCFHGNNNVFYMGTTDIHNLLEYCLVSISVFHRICLDCGFLIASETRTRLYPHIFQPHPLGLQCVCGFFLPFNR
ncbi:MAG: hypothetical protein FWC95_02150 [Defluviitaleaceae bacterium]|nr:hypothetical protein [Defluviitaleaceae bacterium]